MLSFLMAFVKTEPFSDYNKQLSGCRKEQTD